MTPAPRYKHNCDKCVYLGHFEDFDLYICPEMKRHTVVARYGDTGKDYYSGLALGSKIPAIAEAKKRAHREGLLTAEQAAR